MTLSAPSVSAKLRAAGFGIVATRNREGIRVSRGATAGRVCVSVDLDRPGEARRTAALLTAWLQDNAATQGWHWKRHDGDGNQFAVWAKEPQQTPAQLRRPERLQPPQETPVEGYVAQKPLQPLPGTRAGQDARALRLELRRASIALEESVSTGIPAQADITAARTALEALIELAGGDQ